MGVCCRYPADQGRYTTLKIGRMERASRSRLKGLPYVANGGKGGRLVRSRRTGVSVVAVYWSVMVTIVNVCCVYWFGSKRLR